MFLDSNGKALFQVIKDTELLHSMQVYTYSMLNPFIF